MSAAEMILVVLFVAFLIGTILKIVGMLERKRAGGGIDRARLVFFFLGSLMLVSMVPMRIFGMLTEPVMAGDLAVVVANFAGYALTYQWGRKGASGLEEPAPRKKVRAYQIYYHGRAYALITKEGIDMLLAHKLLKRQHTVELVEDFQTQAQSQGLGITLLRNKDGSQMLLRVEGPAAETPTA